MHRGGDQFRVLLLLLHAFTGLQCHGRGFLCCSGNLCRGRTNFLHHALQLIGHIIGIQGNATQLIPPLILTALSQIAFCQCRHHPLNFLHRQTDIPGNQYRQDHDSRQSQQNQPCQYHQALPGLSCQHFGLCRNLSTEFPLIGRKLVDPAAG